MNLKEAINIYEQYLTEVPLRHWNLIDWSHVYYLTFTISKEEATVKCQIAEKMNHAQREWLLGQTLIVQVIDEGNLSFNLARLIPNNGHYELEYASEEQLEVLKNDPHDWRLLKDVRSEARPYILERLIA